MYKCPKFHKNRRWCRPSLVELTWIDPKLPFHKSINPLTCQSAKSQSHQPINLTTCKPNNPKTCKHNEPLAPNLVSMAAKVDICMYSYKEKGMFHFDDVLFYLTSNFHENLHTPSIWGLFLGDIIVFLGETSWPPKLIISLPGQFQRIFVKNFEVIVHS